MRYSLLFITDEGEQVEPYEKAFEVKNRHLPIKQYGCPTRLIGRLEQLAKEKDISFNKLVVQCCEFALDNLGSRTKNDALEV